MADEVHLLDDSDDDAQFLNDSDDDVKIVAVRNTNVIDNAKITPGEDSVELLHVNDCDDDDEITRPRVAQRAELLDDSDRRVNYLCNLPVSKVSSNQLSRARIEAHDYIIAKNLQETINQEAFVDNDIDIDIIDVKGPPLSVFASSRINTPSSFMPATNKKRKTIFSDNIVKKSVSVSTSASACLRKCRVLDKIREMTPLSNATNDEKLKFINFALDSDAFCPTNALVKENVRLCTVFRDYCVKAGKCALKVQGPVAKVDFAIDRAAKLYHGALYALLTSEDRVTAQNVDALDMTHFPKRGRNRGLLSEYFRHNMIRSGRFDDGRYLEF